MPENQGTSSDRASPKMAEKRFNLLHALEHEHEHGRDAYGFVLRPQQVQRYREYASIYKEEEEERSDKWKIFLEQQAISHEPLSIEDEVAESFPAGITKTSENGVERSWEGYYSRQKSESDSQTERDPEEQVQLPEESEEEVQLSKVPVQHSEQPEKEVHASKEPRKEKNCREQESEEQLSEEPEKEEQHCKHEKEEQLSRDPEKEKHLSKDTELRGFQTWSSIRPSLAAIEHMMGLRVKSTMDMEGEQGYVKKGHLPSIKETESSKVEYEGAADKEIGCNGASDESSNASREEKSAIHSFPESLFPWKEELEFLVRGGVPKDLRGEVWQAFVGVKARRVERYYEKLLAQENSTNESKDPADSTGAFRKWRKQIEKDIPRTFPGHPALNEHGRDSLRRLLLAYARHNPSVGYCQAMNFFAGLLLLLMPEENAFWTLVGIIDEYFEGYYTEEMIESQVDQLVFEELMRERFPKLVNHLDYLGVQVTWISGPWFLSIFVNMLPWESVLRVWDVLLYEGNRVMLFRTALALMDLYGPALVTTEDAGDAITLLQSLAGSTFDSSQLVFTACMGFLAVTEAKLQELREKHRTSVLVVVQERSRGAKVWKDSKGIASKLYSFKHDKGALVEEKRTSEEDKPQSEARSSNLEDLQNGINIDTEVDSLPDLQEQVVWLKVELCRLLEEKRSAILRAEELETALMEVVSQDNRRELTAKIEQLEQEVAVLRRALTDKKEQESAMLQVLLRVEQEQRIAEEARLTAEQDASAQKHALNELQEKYEKAMASVAQMEKRVVMAESMLEATLNYESGQAKALSSPRLGRTTSSQVESPRRKISLFGWRDRNKGRPSTEELGEKMASPGSGLQQESIDLFKNT